MISTEAHRQIIHALTEWARRQERRDRHHNPRFIGIAFLALDEAEANSNDPRAVIVSCLNGRCCDFVLKSLGLELQSPAELRQ